MKKLNKNFVIWNLLFSAIILFPLFFSSARAQTVDCPAGFSANSAGVCIPNATGGSGPSNISTLKDLITTIIQYALYFAGVIAVLAVIYGGYLYITARGNEEQTEKGRKALTNAIIGIVVVGLAFMIVRIVSNSISNGPT